MNTAKTEGYIEGVEAATGSLGHGLPMALGMAIAKEFRAVIVVVTLLSDGECNESIWRGSHASSSTKSSSLNSDY